MSKKLVKILSICAIAVLIPLIVLGVALSVSYNRTCTLEIFDGGDGIQTNTTSEVAIYVENQKIDGTKIEAKKGTEITVTWEGTGFDFVGWYNGNEGETQGAKAVNKNPAYTFSLKSNRVLTAIKKYVTYSVNVQTKEGGSTTTISYTREGGFAPYGVTRDGYTFKGLKYDGNVYTPSGTDFVYGGSSLSNALLTSATHSIDTVAVWECDYANLSNFTICTVVQGTDYPIIADGASTSFDERARSYVFQDTNSGVDLSDVVFDKVFGTSKYFIDDDSDREVDMSAPVKLTIIVNQDSAHQCIMTGELMVRSITFKGLIDFINSSRSTKLTASDSIRITYTFNLK